MSTTAPSMAPITNFQRNVRLKARKWPMTILTLTSDPEMNPNALKLSIPSTLKAKSLGSNFEGSSNCVLRIYWEKLEMKKRIWDKHRNLQPWDKRRTATDWFTVGILPGTGFVWMPTYRSRPNPFIHFIITHPYPSKWLAETLVPGHSLRFPTRHQSRVYLHLFLAKILILVIVRARMNGRGR